MGAALSLVAACSSDDGSGDADNGGGAPGDADDSGSGGSATTGGSANTGGSATTGGSANTGGSGPADVCAPYATFEGGEAKGFWVRKNPDTADGTITPSVSDLSGTEVVIDTTDGADGTSSSIHYAGSDFTPTGAGPGGINISNDLTNDDCKDASGYTGVSLWAKGTTAADASSWAVAANEIVVVVGDGTNEMTYRAAITSEWGNIQLAFSDTDGWYNEENVNLETVKYLKLLVAGATFDVSFDQLGWY